MFDLVDIDPATTYKAMEKLLDTGKVRAIGVSNFSVSNLEKLLKTAKIVPAAACSLRCLQEQRYLD